MPSSSEGAVKLGSRQIAAAFPLPLVERIVASDAWSINTYRACDVRCTYCITRAQGRSTPRFARHEVRSRLGAELDSIGALDRVSVGSLCDAYPSVETDQRVTREALVLLADRRVAFRLITKGPAVVRDADLLAREQVEVQVSLNTLSERAVEQIEPGAASPSDRLATLHRLASAGVGVRLQVAPWIPRVSDVAALLRHVDPAIPVTVTPLRLPPYLRQVGRRLGLTQAAVNEAFRQEYEAVGPRPNVRWSRPPSLDGAPPRIEANRGRKVVTDWEVASAAHPDWVPVALRPQRIV